MKKILCLAVAFFMTLCASVSAFAGTSYTTNPATNITKGGATLNGTALTTVGPLVPFFEWGLTTQYGNHVVANPQGTNGPVSANINGLQCGTTYHFRLYGTPGKGGTTVQGTDLSFTTAACAEKYVDVSPGPIWNQQDAEQKCPAACSGIGGTWSGQWNTSIPGQQSECGCWVPQQSPAK
jgi:hypothetical protein